jgi:hypothetical protein
MNLVVDFQVDGISVDATREQLRAILPEYVERLVLTEQSALITVNARDAAAVLALDGIDFAGQALKVRILARRVVSV